MNVLNNKLIRISFLVIFFFSLNSASGLSEKKHGNAYNFSLFNLDGKIINLSDFEGKVVLLNFWATWCAPCLREMPLLEEFNQLYSDEGLQVIGIAIVSKKKDVPKKANDAGVTFPICVGEKKLIADYGYFTSIPHTFLIDRKGKIVKEFSGSMDKPLVEKEILSLLRK